MKTLTASKLTALALIVGPIFAVGFFLVQPGGLLVDPADVTDVSGSIEALSANATLTRATVILISLGLIVMLYGLSGLVRMMTGNDVWTGIARFGILTVTLGFFGWIFAQGLTSVLANAGMMGGPSDEAAVAMFHVDAGIGAISGVAASLGYLGISLGVYGREAAGIGKMAALAVAVVSAVMLVARVVGVLAPEQLETMTLIARVGYFPAVIWTVYLGVNMLRGATTEMEPAAQ